MAVSVMVVDDDVNAAGLTARYLKSMRVDVAVYTDPEKCLSDVEKKRPDIVITDLRMPKLDGLALLERVKKLNPSVDVIMVTGNADKAVAIQALKLGAFDFFEKPVDSAELIETIKKTLRYRAVVEERNQFADQVSFLSQREARQWGLDAFIGRSKLIRKIVDDIKLVQRTPAPRSLSRVRAAPARSWWPGRSISAALVLPTRLFRSTVARCRQSWRSRFSLDM